MNSVPDLLEELACALWGPTGFRCPKCGHDQGSRIRTRPRVRQCRKCHAQVSITARTALARTKIDLRTWQDFVDHYLATGQIETTTELASKYGIARSTAWAVIQKVIRYDRERTEVEGTWAVFVHRLRCRRPKPIPLPPSAPAEVRRLHAAHVAGTVLPPIVAVSFRRCSDQIEVGEYGLNHDEVQRSEVERARAEPAGFARWLRANLYYSHRGVSLRWLPRWLSAMLGWWNLPPGPPLPWSTVAVQLGPRPLKLLDPWLLAPA